MPYESFEAYSLPSSDILYKDLPTILNSHEEPIIDVESYFKNEQDFIRRTLNNACARILETYFGEKISPKTQANEFKAKVYENFFSIKTSSFLITIKCDEPQTIGDYSFQKMRSDGVSEVDEITKDRINKQVSEACRLAKLIRRQPGQIVANEIKALKGNHETLMDKENTKFYKNIVTVHKKEMEEVYNKIIENISDKDSIDCKEDCILALTI